MERRTIAVTGSSGLIGSHLLPILLAEGCRVRILNRRRRTDVTDVTQVIGDIRSEDAARDLIRGCSAVIHLAGVAHTALRSQSEMDEAEQINVGGTRNILAAQNAGVERVLLASSAHVYAGQEGINLDEHSPTAADSFYAATKLMVEAAGLEAASVNRMVVVIVRPCLTYGPGVRFNLASLLGAIHAHYYFHIRRANPMRSFLSVGNAAAAISHLSRVGVNGGIYNLADQIPMPLVDFVNSLADLMRVRRPGSVPEFAIRAAIAGAAPLQWLGLRLPINSESLRKLTVTFTLNVKALLDSGFQWPDDGLAARESMVDAYLGTSSEVKTA